MSDNNFGPKDAVKCCDCTYCYDIRDDPENDDPETLIRICKCKKRIVTVRSYVDRWRFCNNYEPLPKFIQKLMRENL